MATQVISVAIEFTDEANHVKGIVTLFAPRGELAIGVLSEADSDATVEERIQIYEAVKYEYEVAPPELRLALVTGAGDGAIKTSDNPRLANCGSIDLGSYVGRLRLKLEDSAGCTVGRAAIEVCSRKLSYREDLRTMLEDISKRAVELAFSHRSPTSLRALPDPSSDARILYQQFAFLSGLLNSKSFSDALHLIERRPHERLDAMTCMRSVASGIRPTGRMLKHLSRGGNRAVVPASHPLSSVASSLPISVPVASSAATTDTPENRFVRFALLEFIAFLLKLVAMLEKSRSDEHARLLSEAVALVDVLEMSCSRHPLTHLSALQSIPFASTVLQNQEGYREIFQSWLKFDLAARLTWDGAADVYDVGQRDVATLYEYWVFFKLIDVLSSAFVLDEDLHQKLFEPTADGMSLKLKAGESISFGGRSGAGLKRINLRFDYNRLFSGEADADRAGSWTERMQPDYTLSLWVGEGAEDQAAARGKLVHIHFDAKYKVSSVEELFDYVLKSPSGTRGRSRERKYKRVDLLKMHAYRDAIRRTVGAFVLYPGAVEKRWESYHEILPGLGAFALRPGASQDGLLRFIEDLKAHLLSDSVQARVSEFSAVQYAGVHK